MSTTVVEITHQTDDILCPPIISVNIPQPSQEDVSSRNTPLEPLECFIEEPNTHADEESYPTGAKFNFICLSMGLVLVLDALDTNILPNALPAITDDFQSISDVGWYSAVYRLAACSAQFLYGKLYKMFPIKTLFLGSTLVSLVGSTICASAPSSPVFILGRAVTGLASAGIIAGIFTTLVHIMPLRKRPLYTSMYGALESGVVIVAPLVGGLLTQRLGWRWCFWISLPVGGIAFVAMLFLLPELRTVSHEPSTWRENPRHLDLVGNLVFVPSLTCLFMALSWGGTRYAWNDARIIILFVVFVVLLGAFCVDQYMKQDSATILPRLLKNRNVLAGFFFSACTSSIMMVLQYYMPTYFQAVRGASPSESAVLMLPIIIGFLVAMLILGGGISITGYYAPFMLFASIAMPIGTGLMTLLQVNTDTARLIAYTAFAGFAGGIGYQAPQTAVQNTLPTADTTMGLAVILFGQSFGPAVFVIVAQTVFTSRLSVNLDLDGKSIEGIGFSDLRNIFGKDGVDQAVMGVDRALSQTWYLAVGLACLTVIGSLGMEWRSVKQKRT